MSEKKAAATTRLESYVLLEDVPGVGTRGAINALTKEKATKLGAAVRPANSRDLEIAGQA